MGTNASAGFANIWNVNSIEIKVIAILASVDSRAALGVILLIQPPTNAPAISIIPLDKHATKQTRDMRISQPCSGDIYSIVVIFLPDG